MSDPVKEAVERLYHSAKLCTQYDLSHFTVRGSDLTAILSELSRLSRLVEEAGEALGKFMPIEVLETPDYANVVFGEHQSQAMTMAPDDWLALNDLHARASLTHKAIGGGGE